MIRSLPILAAALLFTAPLAAQNSADDIDWKSGGVWSDLSTHIGTYDYDAVLGDERVAAALTAQLGTETLKIVTDNLATRSPIGFENDCLLLRGNAPSGGGTNAAFIAVCLYKGAVHTVLVQNGEVSLFTAAAKYEYLPYSLKMWVYGQKNHDVFKLPDGVSLRLTP